MRRKANSLGGHSTYLVVVDDFDIVGAVILPAKADAPLAVDSYTVLATTIPRQCFESVSAESVQFLQGRGFVEIHQSSDCLISETLERRHRVTVEQPLGIPVSETPNHRP